MIPIGIVDSLIDDVYGQYTPITAVQSMQDDVLRSEYAYYGCTAMQEFRLTITYPITAR
jgi:hypothetical protein